VLRLASWRASRSGLEGELVHPLTARPVGAEVAVRALLEHVAPALRDIGDLDTATDLTGRLLSRGNGAMLQRRTYEKTGDLAAVVRDAADRTLGD
jgi:carboxylate-amine ligase